ncbi:MAG TPA: 2-phosphosulfolactate phosphatase family protein [Clostridiaceae bacterium]
MKIDIIISARDIIKEKIKGKNVLVIDMLRATSVILTALDNGCLCVIPTLTTEEAINLKASSNEEDIVLGGERKAIKIPGFDLSNSPLEYNLDKVKGKTVIITTTNGTRAIKGCLGAKHIFIGALINGMAAAKKLYSLKDDIVIVNAGTEDEFSIDDFICSGYIISKLEKLSKEELELTDIAKTAKYIYNKNKDVISFLKNAKHYERLISLKLNEDLAYCLNKSIINIVPEYRDDKIIVD